MKRPYTTAALRIGAAGLMLLSVAVIIYGDDPANAAYVAAVACFLYLVSMEEFHG